MIGSGLFPETVLAKRLSVALTNNYLRTWFVENKASPRN